MLKASTIKRYATRAIPRSKKGKKLKPVQFRKPTYAARDPSQMKIVPEYMDAEEGYPADLDERVLEAFKDNTLSSMNVLEDMSTTGELLSDSQVAMLTTKIINDSQQEKGTLTVTLLDLVIEEAERFVQVAQDLGHHVGPETTAAMIVLLANPTNGPAREVEKALAMLKERCDELEPIPTYVIESILKGCALDDDEDIATETIEFSIDKNIQLSQACWTYAISSCNTITAAEKMTKLAPEFTDSETKTHIYTSLVKVAAKQQLPAYAENVITLMKESNIKLIDDTYVGWLLAVAPTQPDKVGLILSELISEYEELPAPTIETILHVCMVHATALKGDPFTKITIDILNNIEDLGYHRHQQILSRMMRIFTKVGRTEKAEEVYAIAKRHCSPAEEHYWDLLRQARQAGGDGKKAANQHVVAMQEKDILFEYNTRGEAVPIKELHPAEMTVASLENKPLSNLGSRQVPSTPKM
eukprot:TRINITY_DN20707_c0_g1_i1.p1 TRINITY_DN20707_c0_g1~~TRINITY_DN20707_c0_g1_i1.p1  ORF type:complete len:471 (+),score=92.90 TRINITY_DN20707_c0_g1_i1:67-1479(+)